MTGFAASFRWISLGRVAGTAETMAIEPIFPLPKRYTLHSFRIFGVGMNAYRFEDSCQRGRRLSRISVSAASRAALAE